MSRPQPEQAKWIVAGILVFAALAGFVVARQLTGPFIGLATQQACSSYGDDLGRPVTSYEKERKLSLFGRTDGHCVYGPIELEEGATEIEVAGQVLTQEDVDAQPETVQVSLADMETGGLYRAVRLMSAVLQLGGASVAVRLLADPLLDRFVRD